MEGFLEANQVVEISLSKLAKIKRTGALPLRKTLMVSGVLSRAQELATSAQDTLLLSQVNSTSSRRSSKLLASFTKDESNVDCLPVNHHTLKGYTREQSPIAVPVQSHELESVAQEPMDVDSFLGTILQDMDSMSRDQYRSPLHDIIHQESSDLGASCSSNNSTCARSPPRPVSPGKRNYQQAFPFITEQSWPPPHQENNFDQKRFKACPEGVSPLDSLPGFCGYLSTKNLQTAPFITYMFGKGFTRPSHLDSLNDWPSFGSEHEGQDLLLSSNTTVPPILAF